MQYLVEGNGRFKVGLDKSYQPGGLLKFASFTTEVLIFHLCNQVV